MKRRQKTTIDGGDQPTIRRLRRRCCRCRRCSLFICVIFFKSRTYNWTDNVTFRHKNEREKKIKSTEKKPGPELKRIEEKTKKWQRLFSPPHRQSKQRRTKSRCTFVIFVCIWNGHGMGTHWTAAACRAIDAEAQILWNLLHRLLHRIPSIRPARAHNAEPYSHVVLLRIACLLFLIESNCRPYLPLQFIHKLTISLWTNVMIAPIDVVWKMTSPIRLFDE